MCRKYRGASGISAIVGGLIILAILFTVIIPLMVLIQNSYALFLSESNSRRIFDTERMSESLTVEVSQDVKTGQLVLMASNNGPVSTRIVRVWIVDVDRQASIPDGGPCLDRLYLTLPPGTSRSLSVQQCVNLVTGLVQFVVVTERGRLFSSDKVYLRDGRLYDISFPHTLTVSIINMKKGKIYEVRVTPHGNGHASPDSITHKATASNENVTVAFGVLAGHYTVALYEDNRIVGGLGGNPQRIEVPETTSVVFDLGHKRIVPTTLEVIIIAPKAVKSDTSFQVEVDIRLPSNAEEPVTITTVGSILVSSTLPPGQLESDCDSYKGFIIFPGERNTVIHCIFSVGSVGSSKGDVTITVPRGAIAGVGDSGLQYINMDTVSKTITVRR